MTKQIVLLQALAYTPGALASLLIGAGEANVNRRPSPGDWSILEILAHLIDVEQRTLQRLERVVAEARPTVPVIHPEPSTQTITTPPADLMRRFEQARAMTLSFLKGIAPEDWQRPAKHQTLGETDFTLLVQLLVDHDAEHLSQMAEALEHLKKRAILGE